MNVLALDPSFRATGWVFGIAGKPSAHGVERMKIPSQDWTFAPFNMGAFLLDFLKAEQVDLIAYEEPMPPQVFGQKDGEGRFRPQNTDSLIAPWVLAAAIELIAKTKDIETFHKHRSTVLKAFTGRGGWGSRQEAKRQTIDRCVKLGLVPEGFKNNDVCDAYAIHWHASVERCKAQVPFVLHAPAPPKKIA